MRRIFPYLMAIVVACLSTACGTPGPSARSTPTPSYRSEASTPLIVGPDHIQVLAGGEAAFTAIRGELVGARTRIDLEMYELGRADLLDDLIAAHRRGVTVTVIDDPTVNVTAVSSRRLRAEGVDVVDYPVRKMMIDHVKLLVADDRVAIVGGINWGAHSARNHDFDARLEGPAVANLGRVFATDLVSAGRTTSVADPVPDPSVLVATTLPGADIRPLVLTAIDNARTSLDLQLFVLTDVGVVHALERATDRGVQVRILLDPHERPSDASRERLVRHGVDVRLYRSHGEKLHAKVMVADARTVVFGSANWSNGGFERNHECDVVIPDQPAVAALFLAPMRADWASAA